MEKLLSVGWIKHSIGSFELDYKWDVSNGETLALFGPSGSGKSLTLNLLSGFITLSLIAPCLSILQKGYTKQ